MKIPVVEIGDVVHMSASDNKCMVGIISAITDDHEKLGSVIIYLFPPTPTAMPVCIPELISHHRPENENDKKKGTWHLRSECCGGAKRIKNNRLVH